MFDAADTNGSLLPRRGAGVRSWKAGAWPHSLLYPVCPLLLARAPQMSWSGPWLQSGL